jgi:hypothetical protein
VIIPFGERAPTLESLRERATDGLSTWLFRLVDAEVVPAGTGHSEQGPATAGQLHRFVRDVVTTNPVSRSSLAAVQVHLIEFALQCVDWDRLAGDRRLRGLDWDRASVVNPRTG